MGELIEIPLTAESLAFCEQFRRDILNSQTNPDREMTPDEQYHAKLGECALAKYLRMDREEFKALAASCADYDVRTPRGMRVDVKSSHHPNGNTLYWPVKKNWKFDDLHFDMLAFCNTSRSPIIEFRGWVFKQEFRERRLTSRGQAAGDRLYEGTWYWDGPLRDPETIFDPFKEGRAPCTSPSTKVPA